MRQRRFMRTAGALVAAGLVALTAACGGAAPNAAAPAAEPGAGFPRTIATAKGEVTIPKKPERVVVLDTAELDSVTLLGITPVAAIPPHLSTGEEFPAYLREKLGGTALVGPSDSPKLELIASLKPDLILTSRVRHDALYDQLARIAPTVMTETTGFPWKQNLAMHAAALGKEAEAQAALQAYEARAKRIGDAIIAKNGGTAPTVSVTRFMAGKIRLYQKSNFSGVVLTDAGMTRPPSQNADEFDNEISPELIDMADADTVFVTTAVSPEKTQQKAVESSALWTRMNAVRNGRVFPVPDETWMSGIGVQAANLVLDDLAKAYGVAAA
ncbi:iron-siderophore ABC transporter substrate-binding protein [Saccharopolyspora shandongensis]|uniref:Iron complex transport system substrate-binding protein n=1 Tax=Saccharopolyspora shandongensis TaxID=418495 RepID=A0A1H3NW55_9PSEU|nr:iron-siderophore ABC transporter substrate-binding protein [Saccharopolyspora shandongensis]SDY93078.1 iron complex transport system substrate-binding protein [Saccharopolyspora shandongensis]